MLGLLAQGVHIADIGKALAISRHTVGDHVKSIYRKRNISSRAEACPAGTQHEADLRALGTRRALTGRRAFCRACLVIPAGFGIVIVSTATVGIRHITRPASRLCEPLSSLTSHFDSPAFCPVRALRGHAPAAPMRRCWFGLRTG
ncbi:MAG: LuxR C-terminal-related transcriptional regulator [Burkholderiales bacterium]|nr:LuxR C-terminal-related transcriptional regulator [Burkholderiales bacterium]